MIVQGFMYESQTYVYLVCSSEAWLSVQHLLESSCGPVKDKMDKISCKLYRGSIRD